ncbi:hypothetical protein IKL45_00885 [Candidatus Saccharibacteria bacterium]|nr:hypothetical protein [Candidatus Saccharibacteria bacterium]MBR6122989.1 hypothetical protein [Candidatus Saccharibacteria bacterium]
MNNDELQKAIDDITNNNAAAEAAPAADATAENEQLASELAGAAPAAATAEFAPAPAPAPEVPAEPGMPPVAAAEAVAPEMAEAVAPAAEAAPVTEEVAAAPEIKLGNAPAAEAPASDNATLEEAYKELYPLLDKVELPVEEKFEITLKFGEPSEALELAKQIAEPTAKANALLKIVNKLK